MLRRSSAFRGVADLLWAQVASQMGDAAFGVLLIWAVLEMTDSKPVVGAVATLNYLPVLLFGMVGGLAADRASRRGIMVASDSARAAIALSLPLLGAAGLLGPWVLAAAGFALFTASAFFNPARDAAVPSLVAAEDLVAANSIVQISVPLGWLFGPALCTLFLAWVPVVELFTGCGVLFLVSVAFLARLPRTPVTPHGGEPALAALAAGLRVAWRDVRLRWLLVITAVDNLFIMGPAVVGTPLFVKGILHAPGQVYALAEATLALGVVVGLPLTARLNRAVSQGRVLILGILLDGITYLPLLWVSSAAGLCTAMALHGVSIPMITVTRASLVQRITPAGQLGRVFALISIGVTGLTAVSSGLTGVAAALVPVNVIFGAIAVLAALCAPAAWSSREFRDA
ncbi:MAG TPA: MFS transporter [Thermoanaerobaculaceae bacterium]|nr:MFS transporter [Thermoanaerobaculaceae bacterium]